MKQVKANHRDIILFTLLILIFSQNLLAETIDFEGYNPGMEYNDDIEGVSTKGLNNRDSLAQINFSKANSGAAVLMLSDLSYDTKPMVSFDFANGSAPSGTIRIYCFIEEGNKKATYINVGTGRNNSDRYFEVKVSGLGTVQYENGENDPEIGTHSVGMWHFYDLTWSDSTFSFSVDGNPMVSNIPVLDANRIPTGLTLYVGDTKTRFTTTYFDDITSDLF